MKKRNAGLALLLSILLLASTCLPAFAAAPREYTIAVTPPEPNAAVPTLDGVTPGIDWEGVVNDAWNLLFTGTAKRSIDIRKYNIPNTQANIDYLYSFFWYTPRFLRTGMTYGYTGSILSSLKNIDKPDLDFVATDPVQNREKYDDCERAITQLLYGIKGDDSLSNMEQCLLLHDRLAAWAGYSYAEYLNGTLKDDDYSAYGPLVLHKGVCNGYALAYNWLLDELGFTTYYTSVKNETLDHGWTKVVLNDGEAYYVDVTWDDPVYDIPGQVLHANFLQSAETFSAGHYDVTDFDMTPDSMIYEEEFFLDVTSEIVRIDGNLYYFCNSDEDENVAVLIKRHPDGTTEQLLSLPTSVQNSDGNAAHPMPKLCAIGDTILYLTATEVRAYHLSTGVDETAFTPQRTLVPQSKFFLNGIKQIDGTVYVTATNKTNGSFNAITVENYTESFDYCNHPTTDVLSSTPGANCLTPGDAQLICTACRALINGPGQGPVGEHAYAATGTTAPTCIERGYTTYTCSVCTDSYRADYVSAQGHDWYWATEKEATCGTDGIKHEACTRCDAIRSENTVIPATGAHSYTAQTVKAEALKAAATCTTAATYYYSCATCGAVEKNDNHTFTDGEPLDHSYTVQTVKAEALKAAATCTNAATYYYSCATCGAVEKNDNHTFTDGEPLDHSYTVQTVKAEALKAAATCTNAATYYYSCAACGAVERDDGHTFTDGEPLAHSYTARTIKAEALKAAATCTNAATYYYSCATCGAVERDDGHTFTDGEPLDHSYMAQTVKAEALKAAATCTAAATYYYSCATCGAVERDDAHTFTDGNPLAHSYTARTVKAEALKVAATCTAAATYYYSCATCGAVEKNDAHTFADGEPRGHDYNAVVTAATCTAGGYTTYTCSRCLDSYVADRTNALGHDWRETGRTDATCTAAGSVTYTCTHDASHTKTETIPQKAHTDANGDGCCDNCNTNLLPNRCPYCGEVHSGFPGVLVGFFHRILAFFRDLF